MKFHSLRDIQPGGPGLWCRQSRLQGVVSTLVLGGVFVGCPFLWYSLEAPTVVWGICAALAVFVTPWLVGDLLRRFRPTNWLLCVGPDALWINLRSYQDARSDGQAAVLRLEYQEVISAGQYTQTYSTPGHRGSHSRRWKEESLELRVRLDDADVQALETTLANERQRERVRKFLGFIEVRSRSTQHAVSMPAADLIRIVWRSGRGNWIAPKLPRVLDELQQHVALSVPEREDLPDWTRLSDAEFEQQVQRLALAGAGLDAKRLVMRRQNCTATEAHRIVEGLTHAEARSEA